MVKIHNTKDKILVFLLSNKGNEYTIRSIANSTKIDYKNTYLEIQNLINNKIIISKRAGQTVLCKINQNFFSPVIFKAESIRRETLLKNKNLAVVSSYFEQIKDPFFILLIFGSYASGTASKNSDIDFMLITDSDDIKKQAKSKISSIPLNIHLLDFSTKEFISMITSTKFSVGKEAFNNNIILHGIENYYRLIKYA